MTLKQPAQRSRLSGTYPLARGFLSVLSRRNAMRKLILLAVFAAGLTTAACNTVEGAGKDVSAAGNAVADTARDAK